MAQPVSSPITSTPSVNGQPYDAASSGDCGMWAKLDDNSGPIDQHSGSVTSDFASSAPWQQV
jgi:hypothetical protein